jgi:hypothetical protein
MYSFVPFRISGGYVGYFSYYNYYIYIPYIPLSTIIPHKTYCFDGEGSKNIIPWSTPCHSPKYAKAGDERQANVKRMSSECQANVKRMSSECEEGTSAKADSLGFV